MAKQKFELTTKSQEERQMKPRLSNVMISSSWCVVLFVLIFFLEAMFFPSYHNVFSLPINDFSAVTNYIFGAMHIPNT